MSHKRVVLRELAEQDIEAAVDYYFDTGSEQAVSGFIDELEHSFRHIARHPASGSPRYAHELDLPDVRYWQVKRYPYLVFYIERDDCIDVWRVLHAQRDIPAWMREPE